MRAGSVSVLSLSLSLVVGLSTATWSACAPPDTGSEGTEPPDAPPEDTMTDSQKTTPDHHAASGDLNRLAGSSSPYLLLHQNNPVDWYPWGPEALERSRTEDKPIFLSVGYSTCYWCHVMERESFSDPEIAAIMNEHFVNIKVDREQRPDLDEIYMTATQLMTGSGGWPNSVFMTPALEPFYAGTYFPPEDRYGRPGFPKILRGIAAAWEEKRGQIEQQADQLTKAMGQVLEGRFEPAGAPPSQEVVGRAYESLARSFDATWGGFGNAPKFPTPSNLMLLLEVQENAKAEDDRAAERAEHAFTMLLTTLGEMARGGIYDQIGGGFHRYATDREWKIPHFEKMLYDNGLLMEMAAGTIEAIGAAPGDHDAVRIELERVVRETAAFLQREMRSPEGAFWSAIDAETDGHEGRFYVWTEEELRTALGDEDFSFLAPIYGFDGAPFFEGEFYVLHLPRTLTEAAEQRQMSREALLAEIRPLQEKLFAVRAERERPLTDDKILADWNGLAVAGLAIAGRVLDDDGMVGMARAAADFVLDTMTRQDAPLLHMWRQGSGELDAFLADYVYLVHGLLALHEATGEERWLDAAVRLTEEQQRRLGAESGGYYVAAASPDLLFRSRDVFDSALPAANGLAILNSLELAERTGDDVWRQRAERDLAAFANLIAKQPAAARTVATAVARYHEATGADVAGETPPRRGGEAATATDVDDLEEAAAAVVEAELSLIDGTAEDDRRSFEVRLHIADGWHVNANPASLEFLIPTSVEAITGELVAVDYPEAVTRSLGFADEELRVYEGEATIRGEVEAAEVGDEEELAIRLTYQACDHERCLPPVTRSLKSNSP